MKVKALIPFTNRDATTGELTSVACGAIVEVTDAVGNQLIADGLAEAYTLVTPTGTLNVTENGTYDVTEKASAVVDVSGGSVETVTVNCETYNAPSIAIDISYTDADGVYRKNVNVPIGTKTSFTVLKNTLYAYRVYDEVGGYWTGHTAVYVEDLTSENDPIYRFTLCEATRDCTDTYGQD